MSKLQSEVIADITPQDTTIAPQDTSFERVGGTPLADEEETVPHDATPIINSNEKGESYVDGTAAAELDATATPAIKEFGVEPLGTAAHADTKTSQTDSTPTATSTVSSSKADKSSNKPFYETAEGAKAAVADKDSKSSSSASKGKSGSSKADQKSSSSSSSSSSSADSGEGKITGCSNKEEYVVMIDAGSTGSRVHVYKFDTCFSPPKLLNEDFEMLKPGLSSFDTDTKGAAKSLDPLLEVALKSVPKDKQGCTPVAVKATAGLRLLGEEKASAILKEVRRHLEDDYPFAVVEGEGISMMDGSDEGVYAWITTNYLLGNIGSSKKTPTATVFDLGGGSTQIVFEPVDGEQMIEGEHKYEISFGGRDFTLYQYSHLGYGLMQG
ncbi:unnamed protein product [Ambrosiozyma monospora]|uniref:Unnamed protein product n=1 Tax=Ambrosiozyma monospora TaxID=43982 RepID=A0ACB5TXK7_AMBMO|nr:unnamed protein product [Ambrosiozyma monospora]